MCQLNTYNHVSVTHFIKRRIYLLPHRQQLSCGVFSFPTTNPIKPALLQLVSTQTILLLSKLFCRLFSLTARFPFLNLKHYLSTVNYDIGQFSQLSTMIVVVNFLNSEQQEVVNCAKECASLSPAFTYFEIQFTFTFTFTLTITFDQNNEGRL